MKSLGVLSITLLHELGRVCGVTTEKDSETVTSRLKHEGDGFLTIALPEFSRGFERSLENSAIVLGAFGRFSTDRVGRPSFLRGFLDKVFGKDGVLLDKPSIDCIRAIRQYCLFCKKVRFECSKHRNDAAIDAFVHCDSSLSPGFPESADVFHRQAFELASEYVMSLLRLDEQLSESDQPVDIVQEVIKHGPGATYERISGNQKFVHKRWHRRLEETGFEFFRLCRSNPDLPPDEDIDLPVLVDPGDEYPVRVTLVPKTLAAPRVIAIEPVCMQYAQQALSQILRLQIERSKQLSSSVRFRDQTKNQQEALLNSLNGANATLDLSEASDRVSLDLVRIAFRHCPEFLRMMMACRSTKAELPSGDIITLEKFASMGSALCFPVESIVFYITILASRISRAMRLGTPGIAALRCAYREPVHVYGDDLIVPVAEAPAICDDLESFGFRVNRHKSFWNGKFRESCGVDAYDGYEITPVYLRAISPASWADAPGIVSWVATANQLEKLGLYVTSRLLREEVEKICGKLPQTSPNDRHLGWWSFSEATPSVRWNSELQRREIRAVVPVSVDCPDPLSGDPAMMKSVRLIFGSWPSQCEDPIKNLEIGPRADLPNHLEVSARRYALKLKRTWVPA